MRVGIELQHGCPWLLKSTSQGARVLRSFGYRHVTFTTMSVYQSKNEKCDATMTCFKRDDAYNFLNTWGKWAVPINPNNFGVVQ